MFQIVNYLLIIIVFCQHIHIIECECPPEFLLRPCSCRLATPFHTSLLFKYDNSDVKTIQKKSILCEHIYDSSFDIELLFLKLTSFNNLIVRGDNQVMDFDSFLLYNTTIQYLPENVFGNITFKNIMLHDNFQLTIIDPKAFSYFQNNVELFETLNTNLSDAETIFSIIRQFKNLRRLSMHNDRFKYIPNYAFNHKHLTHIWFGLEYTKKSQPIETIGDYAFYNVPNLQFLRIFSPNLRKINKYSLAQRKRSSFNSGISKMLEIYLGGEMLTATSFELTSLSRFRNRFVFMRFYHTSIKYLDENIFQPFLESNPASLIDINLTNALFKCHCLSAWIQYDYFKNVDQMDNRIYGYRCWDYDFTRNCTMHK